MYLTDENLVGCGSGGKWSQAKKWSPYKKVQVSVLLLYICFGTEMICCI